MLTFKKITLLLLGLVSIGATASIVRAETSERHLNLVAFQANKPGFNYESIVTGNLAELIHSVDKNANIVFATHTTALQPRDIINLQVDVMRMTKQNALANSGLNCRFIFDDESDEDSLFYSISGICDRLVASDAGTERQQVRVKRKMLSDPSAVFNVWMKFYADPETGVAFYVDID